MTCPVCDDKSKQEQISNILESYGYEKPYPPEPVILLTRWIDSAPDAMYSHQEFRKIAQRNKMRADNRKMYAK